MSMTKAQKLEKQTEALEYLKEWKGEISSPSSYLEFRTEYGKGQTDYVSVHLYYQKDGVGHMTDLTFNVGMACGYSFRRTNFRSQLALGGGGYSKSYDVLLATLRALELDSAQVNYQYR